MKDSFLESSAAFVGPVGSEGGRSPSTLSIGPAVHPEAWRRDNAGALGASAKWCFVYCEVNQQKTFRGSWGCRRIGWSAGASGRYRGSTDRCGNARAMQ
jgi:hypothetical protein